MVHSSTPLPRRAPQRLGAAADRQPVRALAARFFTRDFRFMASALTDKLSRLVKEMRGQARITESNVQDMLREVRMALLEADVALPVVRDFIARVKDKALGQEVLGSLKPGQALVRHRQRASWPPPWARP